MAELSRCVEIGATFVENMVVLLTILATVGTVYTGKTKAVRVAIFSAVETVFIAELNHISVYSYITPILAMLFAIFISSRFMTSESLLLRSISCLLAFIVIQSTDYILVMIMAFATGNYENFFVTYTTVGAQRVIYLVIDKTLNVLLYLILKNKMSSLQSLTTKLKKSLLAFSIISYLIMQGLFHTVVKSDVSTLQFAIIFSWMFVLVSVVLVIAFFVALTRYDRIKQFQAVLETENSLMADNYKKLNDEQRKYASELHDFKHHITTMKGLALENKNDELVHYADRLMNVSYLHRAHCHSGNDITDAIINCKYSEAQMLGINFRFSANLHQPISIDSVDICGVLANQIDNAFDACKKIRIGDKEVVIDIKQVNEMVFFKVTNTTADDPFNKNGELKSTKITDEKRHGFGLENMQAIAEKYSGFMQTKYRDGRFISLVMLNNQPFDT